MRAITSTPATAGGASTDRPTAGLLTDLERRWLLNETLVIGDSESGRMPISKGNGGCDHNPHGFRMWMPEGAADSTHQH